MVSEKRFLNIQTLMQKLKILKVLQYFIFRNDFIIILAINFQYKLFIWFFILFVYKLAVNKFADKLLEI